MPTFAQYLNAALYRADIKRTQYVLAADEEFLEKAESELTELWDFLQRQFEGDFHTRTATFSTVLTLGIGETLYNLPTDYWRMVNVSLYRAGDREPRKLRRWNKAQVPRRLINEDWSGGVHPRYYIHHGVSPQQIEFNSQPGAVYTIYIDYHPKAPTRATSGNLELMGYEDYAVNGLTAFLADKQEADSDRFIQAKEMIRQRIMEDAKPKDEGQAHYIADVRGREASDDDGLGLGAWEERW
jgi:hypothetical protein